MVRIKLIVPLILVAIIASAGCQASKTATTNSKPSAKKIAASSKNVQSISDFPHRKIASSKIGTVVPDAATAERRLGFKVRVPKISGLKPEIRVTGSDTCLILFKNGVRLGQVRRNLRRDMLKMGQIDTETASRTDDETSKAIWAKYYRGQAKSTQKLVAEARARESHWGSDQPFYYREINGHPAMVVEKGYYIDGSEKEPQGAAIDWYQDGFELNISGPPNMKLNQLIKIAESAM